MDTRNGIFTFTGIAEVPVLTYSSFSPVTLSTMTHLQLLPNPSATAMLV
jgi:hypothetical protein